MQPSPIEKSIPVEDLKRLFIYDEATGALFRRKTGKVAGCLRGDGRWQIRIYNRIFLMHRVIWAYCNGYWPKNLIDHIDLNHGNNRISNLRESTKEENCRNAKKKARNTSGFKGVSWHKFSGKWRADINVNMRQKSLGLFDRKEDAYAAYCAASKIYHKQFSNID